MHTEISRTALGRKEYPNHSCTSLSIQSDTLTSTKIFMFKKMFDLQENCISKVILDWLD